MSRNSGASDSSPTYLGVDIQEHRCDPLRAMAEMRNWLANVSRRKLPSAGKLERLHARFETDRVQIAADLGFDPAKIPVC